MARAKPKAAKRTSTRRKRATPGSEEQVRAIERRCVGPFAEGWNPAEVRERVNRMRAQGKREEARALEIASRAGCGFDFNEIVLSNPLDGKEHEYECPKCGLQGTYRAPLFGD